MSLAASDFLNAAYTLHGSAQHGFCSEIYKDYNQKFLNLDLHGERVLVVAVVPVEALEALALPRLMVAEAAVRAVDVTEVAGLADAVTALGEHARAVRLVARRHGIVPTWTSFLGTVGPVELGLLALARTEAHGPGRVAEAGSIQVLVVRGTSEARSR